MSAIAPLQNTAIKSQPLSKPAQAGLFLQRQCACGWSAGLSGECEECNNKKIQRKLSIGASNDPLEQEADRVAEQVLAAPVNQAGSSTPPHIRRYTGQTTAGAGTAPASVERVLASPGSPLDPALRQDMGQRFGHDFSQVRIHAGAAAAQSAREVNAHAYTAGHNLVFDTGRFTPGSHEGRRLLAHELTHVVQQSSRSAVVQREPADDNKWSRDLAAARYRGQLIATRIMNHTKLSKEARDKLNRELAYFEGSAKEAYLKEVKPALLAVNEIDMPAEQVDPRGSSPAPIPPPTLQPPFCIPPVMQVSPGKRCKFYVYDSTEPTGFAWKWKTAAFALAMFRLGAYVIPSGESIEEALEGILDAYAEKDCGCTEEVQFFSHGSPGDAMSISKTNDELASKDYNIPGLDKFGDGPTSMPGYREWSDKLTSRQRRLVLLRRTICDPDAEIYYRSCEAFQGKQGQEFAKVSAEFWRSNVVGHTKVIGITQPGRKLLKPCQEPYWPESEGVGDTAPKKKKIPADVKPQKD